MVVDLAELTAPPGSSALVNLISLEKEKVAHDLIGLISPHQSNNSLPTLSMATTQISLPLPVLPEGWTGEKNFRALGSVSQPTQRNIEPVGPHFLAHARRVS